MKWDAAKGRADIEIASGDLVLDTLESAAILSALCDRRALPGDVPTGEDPRGWWADGNDPWGSRLWTLRRAPRTEATLKAAQLVLEEAFAWMVADKLASRVEVEVEYFEAGLGWRATIQRPGKEPQVFEELWRAVNAV